MNVFPSSSTKTLYLRSVRCRDRSSSITWRICSWFCAAYAACTTYRLVVMIIWNPLLSVLVEKAVLLPTLCDNHQWALIVTHTHLGRWRRSAHHSFCHFLPSGK